MLSRKATRKYMETSSLLNSIGLVLGMIGVGLVFFYGISPMIDSDGAVFMIAEHEDENEKKRAKKYNCLSRLGLILIFIGFVLQLSSNFIKN